ncbi:sigma-54 dependent transcriptional regulator [Granulicella mallensis]|uniref:Two component, sigma54 specific, transcriptional regulator, Fis family n=2 Tax=Granulicella mallensis TaxID=940614 RepID=G8NZC8_GRAMM|nr:sigma-54 dependent transcriptional regulator [Granulicella mallensis]AEU37956.1 two component, sigma54 specific, transcriptional regulator, Fis family [Granulicella mallensis MP5ACTX8]MBB5062000.1 two-component system nitrogen regulation response regulator NtrX [Granulicella mallensis]
MNHVLIVDDEADIRDSLEAILREEDYAITTAGTAREALELVRDADYQAVLLDIWLPDSDGLDVLAQIRGESGSDQRASAPEVIMISGHGTIEAAVRATKLGAYDFLEKPLSLDRTLLVLRNAIKAHQLREDNQEFARQLAAKGSVTGQSVPLKALRQQIKLMAPTNGRVLIFGESGTGKELIARAMHAESLRHDRVFVELNCAAIPEDFIETELFGYRHGAGPGGPNQPTEKRGTFERADGGTLFLDEVGDMSLKTQAKVLRALDEQRFYPVGASTPVHVDARVIAATNKDLEEEIARGNFREDLFYRLNVIPFFVPPLRDRKEDIPLLAREFLQEFGQQYGRPRVEISDSALTQLKQYHWPGNVRELRNVIERVLILNPKAQRIETKHLPMLVQRTDGRPASSNREEFTTLLQAREAYERDYILKELDRSHGNVTRAAESLGLERSHLYRKMKTLGISMGE